MIQKIAIVGCSGSGKSYLATKMQPLVGLPLVHLDREYWIANWQRPPQQVWEDHQRRLVAQEQWLIDGHHWQSIDIRFQAAEVVVWVEAPRLTCVWRAFWRSVTGNFRRRADLPEGCRDRVDWRFLRWIWAFATDERLTMEAKLRTLSATKLVVHLWGPGDVSRFLQALATEGTAAACERFRMIGSAPNSIRDKAVQQEKASR